MRLSNMLSLFVVGVLAGYLKITGTQVTKKFKRDPKSPMILE
jgi:hypothetical protein